MDQRPPPIREIASHFGQQAHHYEAKAHIQKKLAHLAYSCSAYIPRECTLMLDIGSGSAPFLAPVYESFPSMNIIAADIALQSLILCKETKNALPLCTDFDHLCIKRESLLAISATSSLQWSTSLDKIMGTIAATLKQRGTFIFGIFLQGTLHELESMRAAFGISNPVHFPTREVFESLLAKHGLVLKTAHQHTHTVYFKTARHLMKHFSEIGASAIHQTDAKPIDMLKLCKEYAKNYSDPQGVVATYQLFGGAASRE